MKICAHMKFLYGKTVGPARSRRRRTCGCISGCAFILLALGLELLLKFIKNKTGPGAPEGAAGKAEARTGAAAQAHGEDHAEGRGEGGEEVIHEG